MGASEAGTDRVVVRPMGSGDWWWLTRAGLSPELIGQHHLWPEAPLQLIVAPTRGWSRPSGPRSIIEVDGVRAGYIGRHPFSGNLEYFVVAKARGGVGAQAIAHFLRSGQRGSAERSFVVPHRNPRSLAALERGLADAGYAEGRDWWLEDGPRTWRITLHARRDPAETHADLDRAGALPGDREQAEK